MRRRPRPSRAAVRWPRTVARRSRVLLAVLAAGTASAQAPSALQVPSAPADSVEVRTGDGRPASLADVVAAAERADVLVLGERHDDAAAHAVQLRLLETLLERPRPVVLSLEMLESDAQTVLDEYLAGLVRERDFLAASRPWSNYADDYRPLVERMRGAGPVVAANAPGRYVSLVSRRGLGALDELSPEARAWLPPVVTPPSDALAAKFAEAMGGTAHGAGPSVEGMLAAQNLRDATMAWRVAEALDAHDGALVVHVNGSFHSADRLGVPEHLAGVAPDARVVVVTMEPAGDAPPEPSADDFVIVTPARR